MVAACVTGEKGGPRSALILCSQPTVDNIVSELFTANAAEVLHAKVKDPVIKIFAAKRMSPAVAFTSRKKSTATVKGPVIQTWRELVSYQHLHLTQTVRGG